MKPKSIAWFERALLTALAIDLVNNLVSWTDVAEGMAAAGMAPSPLAALAAAFAPSAIGLLFWYFIARRRSRAAKWLLTLLVALGTAGFVAILARETDLIGHPMLILAGISEAMKIFAVTRLFTREAKDWLAAGPPER